jgi:hypothetical protein
VNSITPLPEVSFAVTASPASAFVGDLFVFPLHAPAKGAPEGSLAALSAEAAAADAAGFLDGALADLVSSERNC